MSETAGHCHYFFSYKEILLIDRQKSPSSRRILTRPLVPPTTITPMKPLLPGSFTCSALITSLHWGDSAKDD